MHQMFCAHGLRFLYPDDWSLNEQTDQQEVTVTVAGPHTSFWSISLYYERPPTESVMAAALDAFRNEYENLDLYPAQAALCERPTVAYDLDFVCLELINSAFLRAFRTGQFTALVLYQGTDQELDETRDILEAISRSLTLDADDDTIIV
jgi:hypothetical protein